jgi:putative two-component system response regulator
MMTDLKSAVRISGKVLIIDDEPLNIRITRKYLADAGCTSVTGITDPGDALDAATSFRPDVILMDVHMPQMSGLALLEQLKAQPDLQAIPILILTASTDADTKRSALLLGAADFISKPIDPDELLPRLRNAIATRRQEDQLRDHAKTLEREVERRTREIIKTREEVIHCLARAAEFRDTDTGRHIMRVGRYSSIIARQIGCDDHFVQMIELAATLHDVGKIGIPDDVLLKKGKLTAEEFAEMQTHTTLGARVFSELTDRTDPEIRQHADIGAKIFGDSEFELLQLAKTIALTHHEKFDGSGYPLGLCGEDIPLAGRIVAIADVFDALSSKRPYKPAFSREKCFVMLKEGRGSHFDPRLLDALLERSSEIVAAQIELADT